jgi:hypothetical protein
MHHPPPLHPELALRAFEADQVFSTALATFQAQASDHGTTGALLRSANAAGLCWLFRPAGSGTTEVVLRHVGGAEEIALGDDADQLLLGLLGLRPVSLPASDQPVEPEKEDEVESVRLEIADLMGLDPSDSFLEALVPRPAEPEPPEPSAAEVAAESLAAATGGQVFELAEGDPSTPLTEQQRASAVQMVSDLSPAQRKSFAIAFRDGFNVPKAEKSIVPCITELRHLQFVDRYTVEAAGGVAP